MGAGFDEGLGRGFVRICEARLERQSTRPIAVAFSGGGDSLALLLLAEAWADQARRPLVALTLDHRLQPASGDWTEWCAERAARLGVAHRILVWTSPRPGAARAREARHALLAEAARAAGARALLFGHTADDGLEARAMRAGGRRLGEPASWSPSPAWPEGRSLFLLRPLIGARRGVLRDWLRARGETWIEDPANADPRSARALARANVAGANRDAPGDPDPQPPPGRDFRDLVSSLSFGLAGEISLPVASLAGDRPGARALLGAATLCASGARRPPPGAALERLRARLASGRSFVASLAGARLEFDGRRLTIMREAGEYRRAPPLLVDQVFDGRFEISGAESRVPRPLAGLVARLDPAQRRALAAVPPAARGTLPVALSEDGKVVCPILAHPGAMRARCLVAERLLAASGAVEGEAMIGVDVAPHGGGSPGILNVLDR